MAGADPGGCGNAPPGPRRHPTFAGSGYTLATTTAIAPFVMWRRATLVLRMEAAMEMPWPEPKPRRPPYSMTSSARASSVMGKVRPSVLTVLRPIKHLSILTWH
jgi:hypothetical protein